MNKLIYQGTGEKRDKKSFKKLLKDLEDKRVKGKIKQKTSIQPPEENEDVSTKDKKSIQDKEINQNSNYAIVKNNESDSSIQPPEENEDVSTKDKKSIQDKEINQNKNKQIEELNNFKDDMKNEFNIQNKDIKEIENDLEYFEQKMFHSQGGEKTSLEKKDDYDESEGFDLKEKFNAFNNKLNSNSDWLSLLTGLGYLGYNEFFNDKDGFNPDEVKTDLKNQNSIVPGYPNSYYENHGKTLNNTEEVAAKNIEKKPDIELPKINSSISPKEENYKEVNTVDYYREIINNPNTSKLEKLRAKKELAEHIHAHKNEISFYENIDDPESKKIKEDSQNYLNSLGDISDIDLDLSKINTDLKQEEMNHYYKKQKLTVKDEKSWWRKLLGEKDEEKLDSELKKQIENNDLNSIEVQAIYNNLKDNPSFSKDDKIFLDNKISELLKEKNVSKNIKEENAQVEGDISKNTIQDIQENTEELDNKVEKNVSDLKNIDLVNEKDIQEVVANSAQKAPDPEIQTLNTENADTKTQKQKQNSPVSSATVPSGGANNPGEISTPAGEKTSESSNETSGNITSGETAGENLQKTEEKKDKKEDPDLSTEGGTDTKPESSGTPGDIPENKASETNISTEGSPVTKNMSKVEQTVTPDNTSKELAKQTTPEQKPDIVENINNEKTEVQTLRQKSDNFKAFNIAELDQNTRLVLGA